MFRQLFDVLSSTYTYLLVAPERHEAVLVDPVLEHLDDYLELLNREGLALRYTLETHVHADHITASGRLRERLGTATAVGQACNASTADIQLKDGDELRFGDAERIQVIGTPGHTPGSLTFLWHDRLFTGDALLIDGCGRTDFQGGDAGSLYDSITQHLFTLPDETLVYPGHDYQGRRVSCIGEQRTRNPRLAGKTREEFIAIMAALNLPKPRLIDAAVPANRLCGVLPDEEVPHG